MQVLHLSTWTLDTEHLPFPVSLRQLSIRWLGVRAYQSMPLFSHLTQLTLLKLHFQFCVREDFIERMVPLRLDLPRSLRELELEPYRYNLPVVVTPRSLVVEHAVFDFSLRSILTKVLSRAEEGEHPFWPAAIVYKCREG
jgi:hypothetical protein